MSSPKAYTIFTPGAPRAEQNGCLCDVIANAHGAGVDQRTGEPVYAINVDCPIHGTWIPAPPESLATIADSDAQLRVAELRYKAVAEMSGLESLAARAAFEAYHAVGRIHSAVYMREAKAWADDDW